MEDVLVAVLEPLVLVGYTVLAAGLTAGGLALEFLGLTGGSGNLLSVPTLWEVYMGVIFLFAGYLVARDRVFPGLRALMAAEREAPSRNP